MRMLKILFRMVIPGTCYMFECGPADDFRCQFTTHRNYTSAVLTVIKPYGPVGQLEEEIKLNQHESELTRLRLPIDSMKSYLKEFPSTPPTSTSTTTTMAPPLSTAIPAAAASTEESKCSRYQFECHSSKECIAIYNVCDGIPQCSDGSDEAAELGCPTTAIKTTPLTTQKGIPSHNEEIMPEIQTHAPFSRVVPQKLLTFEEQQQLQSQIQNQHYNPMLLPNQGNLQWSNLPVQFNKDNNMAGYMDPNSAGMYHSPLNYGREGERAVMPWQNHITYHQNNNVAPGANNRIFGHKGNNLVQSPDYSAVDTSANNMQYKINNIPYSFVPAYQRALPANGANNVDVLSQLAYNRPPEYYYDDTTHQQALVRPQTNMVEPIYDSKPNPVPKTEKIENIVQSSTAPPPTAETPSSTLHPHHKKEKHGRKQMSTEFVIKKSVVEQNENFYLSSAIIVFTLGLFLTIFLAILLCCRVKRKRLRKGGKSAYAHDPDFLVNGMYL